MIARKPKTVNCKFCGGLRDVHRTATGRGRCIGCGMRVEDAAADKPRPVRRQCPDCGSKRQRPLSDTRSVCVSCGAEFERVDLEFRHGVAQTPEILPPWFLSGGGEPDGN